MLVQDRIAVGVRRCRDQDVGRAGQRRRRVVERPVAVEEEGLDPFCGQGRQLLGPARGPGEGPALRRELGR